MFNQAMCGLVLTAQHQRGTIKLSPGIHVEPASPASYAVHVYHTLTVVTQLT